MATSRCSICNNAVLRQLVNPLLDEGMTGAAIARNAQLAGMTLSSEVVNRHKPHRQGENVAATVKTTQDFAILVRNRAVEQFSTGELDLADKNSVPGISAGLKAQGALDKREALKQKQLGGEAILTLIDWLEGRRPVTSNVLQLSDPRVIEGTSRDVD